MNVIIQSFEPDVGISHRPHFASRRLGVRGLDGSTRYFLVDPVSAQHRARTDERMQQFYVLLNQLMEGYKETRTRNMVYHVPVVVPLTRGVRLVETHPSHVTLRDVHSTSCARR
jgi:transformation/transcription domain-associated protein